MRYLELTIAVRPEAVEAAADIVRRHIPSGVSIEPPFQALDEDGRVILETSAPVRLRAWLPAGGEDERAALDAIRDDLRPLRDGIVRPLRSRHVEDASWADAWKRHFTVLRAGRRLVIKPSWRRHRRRRDDVVIELDPGGAFGTGQHPTTRLCLEALEQRVLPGVRVLDVGAGSGILSIAAALLGAAQADAVDIDRAAVQATKENAAANGVDGTVRVARGSLGEAWPFPEPAASRYDIVLANLSSSVVRELAGPLLGALRREDGAALVSGIIEEHEASCRASLQAAGGRIVEARGEDGWRLLVAVPAG